MVVTQSTTDRRRVGLNEYVDASTYQKLVRAGQRAGVDLTGRVTQGSWSRRVGASGNTHAGAGAADLAVHGWTLATVTRVLIELRRENLAAWYRTPSQGPWPPHIHLINGETSGVSEAGMSQWRDWKRGGNGLGGKDDGPRVPLGNNPMNPGINPIGPGAPEMPESLAALTKLLEWANDSQNWINLLYVILGILLILMAVYRMQKDNVIKIVNVAGKAMK